MMTKQRLDRIGGAGCLLIAVGCMWLAFTDREMGQSLWKVWVGMSLLLLVNGIAMLLHAQRAGGPADRGKSGPQPVSEHAASGPTRV